MTDAEECRPAPEHQDLSMVSDASLLRRLRLGNEDAATQLYLRYAQRLHALARAQSSPELARRIDAEEIVQSVFGSFFRVAGSGHYDVPDGEELWKLFLVIALNKIRAKGAFHRAAKRDVRRTASSEFLDSRALAEPHDTAALAFLQLSVDEELAALSPAQRQMVTLRVDGYEVAEIARQTGRSKRTVERLLQAARKKLAHLLEEA
jgi:RNA polymerase sigma-70 factor (ECF subfamily)